MLDSVANARLAQRMSKTKNVFTRQLNVYTSIPCHKGVFASGEHHGYILVDPNPPKNIVLHIPGGRVEKQIVLEPVAICDSAFETMKGKMYLKLPNAINGCDIFLRECNEMNRSFNNVPCDPMLVPDNIRGHLLTLLADLGKLPEGCGPKLEGEAADVLAMTAEEARIERDAEEREAARSKQTLADLEARMAKLRQGGKRKKTRKHKGKKHHKKTAKKHHKKSRKHQKSSKKHHKKSRKHQKKSAKSRKNLKKGTMKGGFDYSKIMCDDVEVKSEANRFFKMKCYLAKDMNEKFDTMVQEIANNANFGDGELFKAFDTYIDKNFKTFRQPSKLAVKKIYTRLQEEAVPETMKYVHMKV
jgi:hypothetical protein